MYGASDLWCWFYGTVVNETNKSLNKIREIINFAISLILFTNMTLLTLLILAVYRTHVI